MKKTMRIFNILITAAASIAAVVVWVRGRREKVASVNPRRIHHDYPTWME